MTQPLAAGSVIAGRYQVQEHLVDRPGYREYRAIDRDVEVEVGLWIVWPDLIAHTANRRRLLEGAGAARAVVHPHLRRIFDVGDEPGTGVYLTVQLATGAALVPRVSVRADELDVLHFATSIAEGLEAAHRSGLVHGRLAPDDVAEVAGVLKVGGAGLWHAVVPRAAAARWHTEARYLAPEVRAGEAPTSASDVYSMGVMLAELVAGPGADDGADIAGLLARVAATRPALHQGLVAAVSAVPPQRPATPAALLAVLSRSVDHELLPTQRQARAEDDLLPTRRQVRVEPPSGAHALLPTPDPPEAVEDIDDDAPTEAFVKPSLGSAAASAGRLPTFDDSDLVEVHDEGSEMQHTVQVKAPRKRLVEIGPPAAERGLLDETLVEFGGLRPGDRHRAGVRGDAATEPALPPADEAGTGQPPRFEAVSMKPAGERPRSPAPAAIDRVQPVLRPLDAGRRVSHPPGSLGNYAPPRRAPTRARQSRWIWLAVGFVAVLVGAGLTFAAVRGFGGGGAPADAGVPDARETPRAMVVAPDASPPRPCADAIELEIEGRALCIDAYESPGRGRLPETGMNLAAAAAACRERRMRLCTSEEWEAACRGEGGASYPYGESFRKDRCNTQGGEILTAGSHPDCVSAHGVHDMSGNVAEWVADGAIRGGSAADRQEGRCSRSVRRDGPDRGYSDVGFRCCAEPAP